MIRFHPQNFIPAFGEARADTNWQGKRFGWLLIACAIFLVAGAFATPRIWARQYDSALYSGMRWRSIGPYRAGRVSAVAGIPGNPAVFYIGTAGGGVWETTDAGVVWKPIFDEEHVASIGAMAIAPSNPELIYVGTGDVSDVGGAVNQGDGVYASTDGGKTWRHIGLDDTHHIGAIWVDPHDPKIVLVAALGHTYAPNASRGVFKTTDGGKTWRKVLYQDDQTGAVDLSFDSGNPRIGFATLWHHYFKPGAGLRSIMGFGGGAIYKTTDEGETWTRVSGHGLPTEGWGRIGVAVARGGRRVFAIVAAKDGNGLYRSDDGGATWRKITADPRIEGNGYFGKVYIDPENPDVVYVMQTSMYRSTDGGRTFISLKGAPGGDDDHLLWIDPTHSARLLLGSDQGATISLDGGRSWSSWYNQPTGQLYHVSTDNQFPYYCYAEQQDSGTVAVPNRSDYGRISYRDWFSVGGFEYGYIAADPLDPNIIYSQGWYGSIVRFDRRTGETSHVFLKQAKYRAASTMPILFSPHDPHALYLGTQYVLVSRDAGMSWRAVSPDLTARPGETTPAECPRPGAPTCTSIYALALSPVRDGVIWAGTTNGVIQVTEDAGKTWRNVSPPGLSRWDLVTSVDASPFDPAAAYAAIDAHTTNDFRPHIFRTRDYGRTWQELDAGIPGGDFVRVVRADTKRQGLLYAGTENGAWVSFDDGEHWQSLQLNLPTTSVRDLAVHGDDLIAATYGRALWILDDLTPLRQIDDRVARGDAYLFVPETALRVRWDQDQETPLPPEIPTGENPPDGAIIDYYLKAAPAGPITLAIYDARGTLVRKFSSVPPPGESMPANVPDYWFGPPEALPKRAGMNRFAWNLRLPHPTAVSYSYFGTRLNYVQMTLTDDGIPGKTPRHFPRGPLVVPGKYEIALTVAGQTYRQALLVKLDPRLHVTGADLAAQLGLERRIDAWMAESAEGYEQASALRAALAERTKALAGNAMAKKAAEQAAAVEKKVAAVESGSNEAPGFGPINRDLARLATSVQSGDMRPSETARAVALESCRALEKDQAEWQRLNREEVPALNAELERLKLGPLPVAKTGKAGAGCSE
jgi:photosystem II stability/assembly factor-like uncharacterized protein